MTVVVGFVGTDGAVMASDSQASEYDKTKYDIEKLWVCHGVLLGYSGNTAISDPLALALDEALGGMDTSGSRWDVIREMCAAGRPVLESNYKNYVPTVPENQIPTSLAGVLLVIGRDEDGYWLADINYNNVPTFHHQRNFHAIGSGSVGAQVATGLMGHYNPKGRTAKDLRLIAYRTVAICIKVVDVGIGGEIQMWSAEGDAPFAKATPKDIAVVKDGVQKWETIERDSLKQVFDTAEERPETPDPGAVPEPLDEPAEPPAQG